MRTLLKRSAYTVLLTAALLATWGENTAVADEFPPREILMVSNGYYYQEYQIIQHIEDLDSSNLTTVADYEMDGNTDLDHYDLIILTGFAPNLSNANIQSISDSAVPVLLVEFWDFIYSYKLGLTNDDFGYFGDDLLDVAERDHPITQSLPDDLGYYDPPYFAFGVGEWALSAGTTALLQGSTWDQVSVFVDDTRKIAATGLSETAFYTESAWLLFDMLCHYLAPVLPEWEGAEGLSYAYEASGLKSFIEYLQNNPGSYTDQEVTDYVYRTLFKWNLFDLSAIIEIILRQAGVPIQIAPLYVFINDLPKIHNTAHDVRRMQDTDRCDDVHCEKDRSFLGENLTDNTSAACKVVDVGVDISKLPDNWDEMSEQDQADFICDPENADVLIKEERCGRDTYTPNAETHEIVYGTDVGMSVRTLNGVTIFHMGDSGSEVNDNTDWGNPSLQLGCRSDIPEACNDPMMILNDSDGPENGIDADLLLHDETPSNWFDSITTYRPLLIPGVNQEPVFSDSPDIIKWFGYATGAESAIAGAINYNPFPWSSNPTTIALHVPYVYLWYATAVAGTANNNPANVNSVARSYLACSVDGIEFHNCLGHTGADDVATLFSTNKFVIVSPVRITTDLWQECDTSDERSLCDLKATLEADDPENTNREGMLLFGAKGGKTNILRKGYRNSPLYLAYMSLGPGELPVWYYDKTGDAWVKNNESAATPILSAAELPADDKHLHQFGEISVKLVKDSGGEAYLVMLANHKQQRVYYHAASLYEPEKWAEPQLTCAVGYGPYLIDEYIGLESGGDGTTLVAYHTIQGWNGGDPQCVDFGKEPGGPTHEAYGVFTTQLRLRADNGSDPETCSADSFGPTWPPII